MSDKGTVAHAPRVGDERDRAEQEAADNRREAVALGMRGRARGKPKLLLDQAGSAT